MKLPQFSTSTQYIFFFLKKRKKKSILKPNKCKYIFENPNPRSALSFLQNADPRSPTLCHSSLFSILYLHLPQNRTLKINPAKKPYPHCQVRDRKKASPNKPLSQPWQRVCLLCITPLVLNFASLL